MKTTMHDHMTNAYYSDANRKNDNDNDTDDDNTTINNKNNSSISSNSNSTASASAAQGRQQPKASMRPDHVSDMNHRHFLLWHVLHEHHESWNSYTNLIMMRTDVAFSFERGAAHGRTSAHSR